MNHPLPIGTSVSLHDCPGVIEKRVKDATAIEPDHWRYQIRWATGTFGWWGSAKVAEMLVTP